MKIYFKAPYYKDSNFMGHLMEHCILHPDKNNIQNCVLAPWIDGSLYPEYMVISFDEYADQKDLFSFINKEITQEVVDYEYKIFEEEFGNSNYYKRVHEKFLKKIYSPQWTRKPSLYTLEEVQSYHKQYIKNGEYIITHHNKIISHNIKSVSPLSLAENLVPKIDYHLIYLEGRKNYILIWNNASFLDTAYFYFLMHMIKSWDSYKKRYELESYFTAPPSTYANNKDCILVISHSTVLDMSEIFFTEQKKYFIKAIRNSDYMVLPITALLFHHQEYDLEKVVQFIEGITYEKYMEVIEKIKTL